MKVFFGAAIQGLKKRGERSRIYETFFDAIKSAGHMVISEHAAAGDLATTTLLLERSIGPLPPMGPERRAYVRNKMIEAVESDIGAAIFEVSVPSLGTGIELAHAYLRPRMRLPSIPILALYEKNFWPNGLSTMIAGITHEKVANFMMHEYGDVDQAREYISIFLENLAVIGYREKTDARGTL